MLALCWFFKYKGEYGSFCPGKAHSLIEEDSQVNRKRLYRMICDLLGKKYRAWWKPQWGRKSDGVVRESFPEAVMSEVRQNK